MIWLKMLPEQMYWAADYDADSACWLAWMAFCDWLPFQSKLLVAEAAQKKELAQSEKDLAEFRAKSGFASPPVVP